MTAARTAGAAAVCKEGKNQRQTEPSYGTGHESNPRHIAKRRVLLPLRHPCFPISILRTFKVSVTISDQQCKVLISVTKKLYIHSTNTCLVLNLSFGHSLSDRRLGPKAILVLPVPLDRCFVEYKVSLFSLPAVSEVI